MTKILVIDPSSEHLAYSICSEENNTFTIQECGMIWVPSSWQLGCKLAYIYRGIEFLVLDNNITHIITETFFTPFKRQSGTSVIPTLNNNLRMLSCNIERETGCKITVDSVSSGEWRRVLGSGSIRDPKTGKRDFKKPCRDKVEQYLKSVLPENIISNTNLKSRPLPSDISDSLGMAIAYALGKRYNNIIASKEIFNNIHTITVLNTLLK